jgi:hypothetical protein
MFIAWALEAKIVWRSPFLEFKHKMIFANELQISAGFFLCENYFEISFLFTFGIKNVNFYARKQSNFFT